MRSLRAPLRAAVLSGPYGEGHSARLLTDLGPQGWREGAARWRGQLRSWGLHHFRRHPTLLGIPGRGGGRVESVEYYSWRTLWADRLF